MHVDDTVCDLVTWTIHATKFHSVSGLWYDNLHQYALLVYFMQKFIKKMINVNILYLPLIQ